MADISLAVVGLAYPLLLEAYKQFTNTCGRIRIHHQEASLLAHQCHSLLLAVGNAQVNHLSSNTLQQEVGLLTEVLRKAGQELSHVVPPTGTTLGASFWQSIKKRKKVEERLSLSKQEIQAALSRFTVISHKELHAWNVQERNARHEDHLELQETLQEIKILLESRTDIPDLIVTLLPEALKPYASQLERSKARDEGQKAAAWFLTEVEALRAVSSPLPPEFETIISKTMDLFQNGQALPVGYNPSAPYSFPSDLLRVRVKYLESEVVHDQDITINYYETVENVIYELRRPRPPPLIRYNLVHPRLYVRQERSHNLSPRGILWTSLRGQELVAQVVPRRDGFHELDLVDKECEYLVAVVVNGSNEKGAVLDYATDSVYGIIRRKWPNLQMLECLRIVERKGYPVNETDTCVPHIFPPYECGLCVRFSEPSPSSFPVSAS